MKASQIAQLSNVTATLFASAQSEMGRIQKQEVELREQLRVLSIATKNGSTAGSPAYRAGADVRWQHWVDGRREEINAELARTLAKKDGARAKLRVAFGKDQAMQQLAKKVALQTAKPRV